MNAASDDQRAAATRDARLAMKGIGDVYGTQMKAVDRERPLDPIGARLIEALEGLDAGTTKPCRHLSPTAPQPAFWAAWVPHILSCTVCFPAAAALVPGSREEHTCDLCGRYAPDTAMPISVQIAMFIGMASLCRRCRRGHPEYDGLAGETP